MPAKRQARSRLGQAGDSRGAASSSTFSSASAAIRNPGPNPPQTTGTQFQGASVTAPGIQPPDSMGAVGPSQFLVMVNGRIRTFNKSTGVVDGAIDTTTDIFWTAVRNGQHTSDPRVRYDRLRDRWFLTMINIPSGSPMSNRVMVAYSDTGTISSTTSFHTRYLVVNPVIGGNGCFLDYDTLGVDVNALYVGGNLFCGAHLGR